MSGKQSEPLEECQERVHELEEENSLLRESATTFGGLAERLRDRLGEEPAEPAPDDPKPDRD